MWLGGVSEGLAGCLLLQEDLGGPVADQDIQEFFEAAVRHYRKVDVAVELRVGATLRLARYLQTKLSDLKRALSPSALRAEMSQSGALQADLVRRISHNLR